MDIGTLLGGVIVGVFLAGLLAKLKNTSDYNNGYSQAASDLKNRHIKEMCGMMDKYKGVISKINEGNAGLKAKIAELEGQVKDSANKLRQLETSRDQEIVRRGEATHRELEIDFGLRRQALGAKTQIELENKIEHQPPTPRGPLTQKEPLAKEKKPKRSSSPSSDTEILTLLKTQPSTHTGIVQITGRAKSTVSDSLKRLSNAGLISKGPSGEYHAT